MSSPKPRFNSSSPPKRTSTSTPGKKDPGTRVHSSSSIFGPFAIPQKNPVPAPEPKKSLAPPPPGTAYRIKAIYIHAPSDVVDFDNYIGTYAQTEQALASLVDQARNGNRTTDEGVIEHVEGSECNVRIADDGMSFQVFAYGWEEWVARVWAEKKGGDDMEYRSAFGRR